MRIDRVKLAAALAMADISSKELASRSGLSRVTVSSVKTGRSCSQMTAEKIACALGVQLASILEVGQVEEVG